MLDIYEVLKFVGDAHEFIIFSISTIIILLLIEKIYHFKYPLPLKKTLSTFAISLIATVLGALLVAQPILSNLGETTFTIFEVEKIYHPCIGDGPASKSFSVSINTTDSINSDPAYPSKTQHIPRIPISLFNTTIPNGQYLYILVISNNGVLTQKNIVGNISFTSAGVTDTHTSCAYIDKSSYESLRFGIDNLPPGESCEVSIMTNEKQFPQINANQEIGGISLEAYSVIAEFWC
jgi:hypothetical protein